MDKGLNKYLYSQLPDDAVSVNDAAKRIGVSIHIVYRAKVNKYKIGGRILVSLREVMIYVNNTVSPLKNSIAVIAKDKTGKMQRFKSMGEAARYFNTNTATIANIIKSKDTFNINVFIDDGSYLKINESELDRTIVRISSKKCNRDCEYENHAESLLTMIKEDGIGIEDISMYLKKYFRIKRL